MFPKNLKARADLKPGTLYAMVGEGGWVYYGQVTNENSVGFFRRRDRDVAEAQTVLSSPIMSVINVAYPSITRALRNGDWSKLGRYELASPLMTLKPVVQWPVGTLDVTVWTADGSTYETRVEDPAIQDWEVMASWDAQQHLPARLTADFGAEEPKWDVGGPIWRERKVKEELAIRAPEMPWHQLPPDWVPTSAQ